jgi:hypothetical protein
MIRLKNGGVVREVETQRESEFYQKLGYQVESQDTAGSAPDASSGGGSEEDADKEAKDSGKKTGAKEN